MKMQTYLLFVIASYVATAIIVSFLVLDAGSLEYHLILLGVAFTILMHLHFAKCLAERLNKADLGGAKHTYLQGNATGASYLFVFSVFSILAIMAANLSEVVFEEIGTFALVANQISNLLGVLFFMAFVYINWIASKSLCYFEESVLGIRNSIFGTFILFFYIVFGGFFIKRRLDVVETK